MKRWKVTCCQLVTHDIHKLIIVRTPVLNCCLDSFFTCHTCSSLVDPVFCSPEPLFKVIYLHMDILSCPFCSDSLVCDDLTFLLSMPIFVVTLCLLPPHHQLQLLSVVNKSIVTCIELISCIGPSVCHGTLPLALLEATLSAFLWQLKHLYHKTMDPPTHPLKMQPIVS